MFKNTKKVFALILAIAVVAMSMFTGVVVSAADPVETAHGTVDLLEFGDYLIDDLGSTSKYYDNKLDDNGETGADWDNAIIIDSAEEMVYLCKASGDDTKGKYYKVADGIAGFNFSTAALDLDGTLADNLAVVTGSGKNHAGNTPGFQGHFDGNGATVYGAWTNPNNGSPSAYVGLFSCTKGEVTIKNINVNKAYFIGASAAGGIIGYHKADDMCTVTIENCSVTDSYIEVTKTGYGCGVGAILGFGASAPSWKEADKGVDGNGDGDMVDTIYINVAYNIKNCYVNLDEDNFISKAEDGVEDSGERVCHGGVMGVLGSNTSLVSDCVVIGIKPYATMEGTSANDVQHSGLESHFANVYTTDDVAITEVNLGGSGALASRDFTGKVFPLTDTQLKGAAAAQNMSLDWSVWMADDDGYPELRNIHKDIVTTDNENGTHKEACECGFGGIDADHAYVDGVCSCGAELNCATRKTIYWDGTIANGIATGTGTEDDPYIIKTAAELAYLVKNADEDSTAATAHKSAGKYYKIDDAIGAIVLQPKAKAEAIMALQDAAAVKAYFDNESGLVEWVEVGWEMSSFCGDFDGNGVTIYGLYSISDNNAGLFSTVDAGAAIKNIALKNSYLTSTATNYQVGGLAAVTSGPSYGRKTAGAIWFKDCVVANNYMYNPCDSHDRTGVIIGSSQDVTYMDNCLVYGNDATYGSGVVAGIWSGANNNTIVSDSFVAPDGLEMTNDGAETPRYYNMVRNSVIFGAKPYDLGQGKGSRFNDPKCFANVLTDADVATDTFGGTDKVLGATEEQIKTIALADLADLELADAFIKTDSYPELRAFHDEVFGEGVANGAAGHVAACSCGLAGASEPHDFVSDVETPEWDSYYCSVCGYVCEHVSEEEGITEYVGDCVTAAGYEYDCSLCGYHEEAFEEIAGHNFTAHEAQKGVDCQTAGTIAYKSCNVCNKNYAADAADVEPFENEITDLTGEKGDCEVLMEADAIVYGKDGTNHWTQCATCGEPIETTAHTLTVAANGAQGHSASCEICGYEADNVPHTFGDDNICDVEGCEWECTEHSYVDGEVKTPGNCTTDKVTAQVCEICGTAGDDKVEAAPGHTPADAVKESINPGDCATNTTFESVVYCEICDEELSRTPDTIPAPGHDYKLTTTKATTSKNGKIEVKCTVCGDVADTTVINAANTFSLSATSYTYDGKNKTPTVTVKDSAGTKLKKNTDYTLSVASSRKNVGTYKVTVTLIGNYTGTKTLTFKINPAKLGTVSLSATSYTYDGKTKTPSVTVKNAAGTKLKKNTDYTISVASSRKNAGAYKVTVKGIGNYTGTKTVSFKINPAKLGSCKLSATTYTYSGKNKTPTVTVKNAAGTKLTKNTHYTISVASNRKNVGTYKVTIKGKGNYTGTKTLTFKINPAKTTVSKLTAGTKSFTVNITKKSTQVTGYQIQYSTSKSFTSAKTKTITSYKTTKATLKSLSAKKTYYVRVRTYKTVSGTKYYSGWSTAKSVKTK